MKKNSFLLLIFCFLFSITAAAHHLEYVDYHPGFFGHPLLESNGYKAENGAFNLELGQGIQNLDNMTDENRDTYATGVNILGLGLGYNEVVRIVPKNPDDATPLPVGENVGFVVSPTSSDVSVLSLSLAKVMAINLLDKEGKTITSVASAGDDNFNVLGLSLVNVAIDGMVKIVAPIPKNLDKEVYGISLSTGGADVNLGHDLHLHYAFVDDLEYVPIIKKYYPNATGELQGMATGGKKLVNNNLRDGAATAILTIGGSYYTVMANQKDENGELIPFPHGVEAGWVMSSGTVLNLEAGGAIQVIGITKDGREHVISTDVNVVGLNLLGGGNTVIPFMTPVDENIDLIGFKLNRINAVDLDLGATLVNYAYVKLPGSLVPEVNIPFEAHIEVIPASEALNDDNDTFSKDGVYSGGTNGHIENDFQNTILILNDSENPLRIPSTVFENDGPWTHHSDGTGGLNGSILTNHNQRMQLGVARTPITQDAYGNPVYGEPVVLGYFDIAYIADRKVGFLDNAGGTLEAKTLYHRFSKDRALLLFPDLKWYKGLTYDEDGIIDLSVLGEKLTERDEKHRLNIYGKNTPDSENNIVAYEYTLYYIKDLNANSDDQMIAQGIDIDTSTVSNPTSVVNWELAGTVNNIDENNDIYIPSSNNSNDLVHSANTGTLGPWSEVQANTLEKGDKYRHYITFNLPDQVDEKANIVGAKLYRYYMRGALETYLARECLATYTRSVDEQGNVVWSCDNDNYMMGQVHLNGTSKLVAFIEDKGSSNQYGLEINCELNKDYAKEVAKSIYRYNLLEDYEIDAEKQQKIEAKANELAANRPMDYGWVWSKEGEYLVPTLFIEDNDIYSTSYLGENKDQTIVFATWNINLTDSKDIHVAQATNGWYERPETDIYNVDIFCNQWSTLSYERASYDSPERINTYAADPEYSSSQQNVILNEAPVEGNSYASNYDIDNQFTADYLIKTEVIYPNNLMYPTTTYAASTRAYIPIVPDGFVTKGLSDNVQTYLAVEGSVEKRIYDISTTDITNITEDCPNAAPVYYNLQGIQVEKPSVGIYIVRRGNTITKEVIK